MKLLIVVAWEPSFHGNERTRQLPPSTAVHLAALCPADVEVQVWHEQVRPVDLSVEADLVAISAPTGSASRMYKIADAFRARGTPVFLGGSHVTLIPEDARGHADAIAVGEADYLFPRMIRDFQRRRLQPVYEQRTAPDLAGLPTPRFDLYEDFFIFNRYLEATRGCPYNCSFCTLRQIKQRHRTRPIDEVIRDISFKVGRNWLQNKLVWFWDDNIAGNTAYASELFRRMVPLKKWWWSQASMDIAWNQELVRLARRSGCVALFVGVESFSAESLRNINKPQNRVNRYRASIRTLHDNGIAVNAGLVIGFDEDTLDSVDRIPDLIEQLELDLPFINMLTPYPGTNLYRKLGGEGRLVTTDWGLFNSVYVTFRPKRITGEALQQAYWDLHKRVYSLRRTLPRLLNGLRYLTLPGYLLNGFANVRVALDDLKHPDRGIVKKERTSLRALQRAAGTS